MPTPETLAWQAVRSTPLLGATVEWTQDLRPMPETVPGDDGGPDSPAWDMSLVTTQRGVVQSVTRTIFGTWVALVDHNGRMKEMNVAELKVVSPNKEISQKEDGR